MNRYINNYNPFAKNITPVVINYYNGNIIDNVLKIFSQSAFKKIIDRLPHNVFIAFSDGACRGNPGPAGAAALLFVKNHGVIYKISRALGVQTNNKSELFAIWLIFCLIYSNSTTISGYKKVLHIFTDSMYCISLLTGNTHPSKNRRLFQWVYHELLFFKRNLWRFHFYYVKAHVDIKYNNMVDDMAVQQTYNIPDCVMNLNNIPRIPKPAVV